MNLLLCFQKSLNQTRRHIKMQGGRRKVKHGNLICINSFAILHHRSSTNSASKAVLLKRTANYHESEHGDYQLNGSDLNYFFVASPKARITPQVQAREQDKVDLELLLLLLLSTQSVCVGGDQVMVWYLLSIRLHSPPPPTTCHPGEFHVLFHTTLSRTR